MNLNDIYKVLVSYGYDPIMLDYSVLLIRKVGETNLVYTIFDDILEVCDAADHRKILFKGLIDDRSELEETILKTLQ